MTRSAPVKVLSIVGATRSGSTILDNILGELDGFFSGGEIHYLWDRGLIEGRLCGCSRPFGSCQLWSAILSVGLEKGLTSQDVAGWRNSQLKLRSTWRLLKMDSDQSSDFHPALRDYIEATRRLYGAIAEVTGKRVIVDSTKMASMAAILRLVPEIEPYYVHLVRDPRGVVYSWQRKKVELDHPERQVMDRLSTLTALSQWVAANLASELLCRQQPPSRTLRVKYEDFMSSPSAIVEKIAALIDEKPDHLPFTEPHTVWLGLNHSVSGNPTRFNTGLVSLDEDVEWRRAMASATRRTVTLLTLPMLRRYGYPVSFSRQPEITRE